MKNELGERELLSRRNGGMSHEEEALTMSVYVSKRNESKVQFLETARKLSAHN